MFHGGREPQEGMGFPLKERVFREGGGHAHVALRLCLKPRHSVCTSTRALLLVGTVVTLALCTCLAPGYGRGVGGETLVMGCRQGAGLGGETWCLQKTWGRVMCDICPGLSILQFSSGNFAFNCISNFRGLAPE